MLETDYDALQSAVDIFGECWPGFEKFGIDVVFVALFVKVGAFGTQFVLEVVTGVAFCRLVVEDVDVVA